MARSAEANHGRAVGTPDVHPQGTADRAGYLPPDPEIQKLLGGHDEQKHSASQGVLAFPGGHGSA